MGGSAERAFSLFPNMPSNFASCGFGWHGSRGDVRPAVSLTSFAAPRRRSAILAGSLSIVWASLHAIRQAARQPGEQAVRVAKPHRQEGRPGQHPPSQHRSIELASAPTDRDGLSTRGGRACRGDSWQASWRRARQQPRSETTHAHVEIEGGPKRPTAVGAVRRAVATSDGRCYRAPRGLACVPLRMENSVAQSGEQK